MSLLLTPKEESRFDPRNPIDQVAYKQRIKYLFSLPYLAYGNADQFAGVPKEVKELQNFTRVNEVVNKEGSVGRKLVHDKEAAIQNMTTQTDYPEFLTNLYKQIDIMEPFDTEWLWFYDWRPLQAGGFDIALQEDNVTTHKTPPGQSVKYYGTSASKYRVYAKWYSTGIAVDRRLLYDRDFYTIEKDLMAQKQASDRKKAEVAYTLMEAITVGNYPAGRDIVWQAPDPSGLAVTDSKYTMSRDAETLNKAAETLVEENKNRPGVLTNGANTVFHVLVPHQLTKRIGRALNYTVQEYAGSTKATGNYTFVLHTTTMLTSSTDYYVGIPKGETVGGSLLNFTRFSEFNKDLFADENAAWESYAFNIGNTEQLLRCKTS